MQLRFFYLLALHINASQVSEISTKILFAFCVTCLVGFSQRGSPVQGFRILGFRGSSGSWSFAICDRGPTLIVTNWLTGAVWNTSKWRHRRRSQRMSPSTKVVELLLHLYQESCTPARDRRQRPFVLATENPSNSHVVLAVFDDVHPAYSCGDLRLPLFTRQPGVEIIIKALGNPCTFIKLKSQCPKFCNICVNVPRWVTHSKQTVVNLWYCHDPDNTSTTSWLISAVVAWCWAYLHTEARWSYCIVSNCIYSLFRCIQCVSKMQQMAR